MDAAFLSQIDALRRAGRMEEAIAGLRARAEATPRDPATWSALADTLAAANRPDLALVAWERASGLAQPSGATLCGKARALQSLGRPGEAAASFEAAVALDPHSFEAGYGLVMLAFEAGNLDLAANRMARLQADHGDRPGAMWLAARLAVARGEFERARDLTQRLLASPDLDAAGRADALLLQSEVLDRLGEPALAFAAAREGKAIQRRLFAGRAAGHESETAKLRRLLAWFQAADPEPWRAMPPQEPSQGPSGVEGHVFLLGFPRSGTTLLEQALAGHPRVIALEEAPTLADPYQTFLRDDEGLARLARIGAREAEAWRGRYWQAVRDHGAEPRGRVFVDKAPAGTLNLPLIAKLFPQAKILFAVRDPRDVVLSCATNAFQMNSLTYAFTDLADTAACYDACMALAEIYRARLPLAVMEARHEALVEDFPGQLAAIAAFVGLSFDPAMTDVATTAHARPVRTPSAVQVRVGLNRRGLGRWRAYAAELAPVREALAPWVERFGYRAD
jgi:tetratricopeptide (TPR) repeat protein